MNNIFNHEYLENKNEDGFYKPLENANTFINKIADDYDSSFKNVVVYGTNEYPLFILKDIRNAIELDEETMRRNIKKFSPYELLNNCKAQIKTIRNGTEYLQNKNGVYMLTKFGVYRAMFISNKPVAQLFREFVYMVLHQLETDKIAKLEDAQKAIEARYSKMCDERDALLENNITQKIRLDKLRAVEECLETPEYFTMSGDIDYMNLCAFREVFCTKTPLYIVDDKFVISKYISSEKQAINKKTQNREPTVEEIIFGEVIENEPVKRKRNKLSDENITELVNKYSLTLYDRDFTEYNEYDYDVEETMYFHIHPFKSPAEKPAETYKKIATIDVLDKEHYKAMIEKLKSHPIYTTKIKNVFQANYNNIIDIAKTTLNERLYRRKI